jgi:hypothetical protein
MLQIREEIIKEWLKTEYEDIDVEAGGNTAQIENLQHPRKRQRSSYVAHHMGKYKGTERQNRKRCTACYKKIQREKGCKEARAKAKRVCTFCEDCVGQPPMCLPCFNKHI